MQQHIKVLGILNIIYGSIGLVAALGLMVLFGGLAGVVGLSGEHDAEIGATVLGVLAAVVPIIVLVISAPSVIAGVGLLKYKSWARMLTIILSAIHLMSIPFGTALGIYGLWALLKPESEALFRAHPPQWPVPPAPVA
jgi:hypothetical protein